MAAAADGGAVGGAAGGPQEQLIQMCFGPGERELNLAAVSARAQELRRTLDAIVADIAQGRGAHWAAFLDRLAVVNVQHTQVAAQLRPLLRQYVAYPKLVDSPQLEADIPALLASRPLPEQEAADAAARAALFGACAVGALPAEQLLAAAEQQLEGLRGAAAALFSGGGASGDGGVGSGPLDPRGAQRQGVDALAGQVSRALADLRAARARLSAAAGAGPWSGQPQQRGAPLALALPAAGQKRARGSGGGGGGAGDGGPASAEAAAAQALLRDLASGAAYRRHFAGGGGGGGPAAAK